MSSVRPDDSLICAGRTASKRRYSVAERAQLVGVVEELREKGMGTGQIASLLGLSRKNLWRWLPIRSRKKPPRVDFDGACWRIYVYDETKETGPQSGIYWWPIDWLRFGSEAVALDYLDIHGEP